MHTHTHARAHTRTSKHIHAYVHKHYIIFNVTKCKGLFGINLAFTAVFDDIFIINILYLYVKYRLNNYVMLLMGLLICIMRS